MEYLKSAASSFDSQKWIDQTYYWIDLILTFKPNPIRVPEILVILFFVLEVISDEKWILGSKISTEKVKTTIYQKILYISLM